MTYNPEEVGYDRLVDLFYSRHNSTTPNRSGNDSGTQYRSGIYYHNEEQKQVTTILVELTFPLAAVHLYCPVYASVWWNNSPGQIASCNEVYLSNATHHVEALLYVKLYYMSRDAHNKQLEYVLGAYTQQAYSNLLWTDLLLVYTTS